MRPISTKAKSSVKVRIFVTQLIMLNLRKQTFLCLNCFFLFSGEALPPYTLAILVISHANTNS